MKNWLLTGCVLVLITAGAQADDTPKDEIRFAPQELVPGLTVLTGVGGFAGGNILLSSGPDGVVMIDDSMPPLLPALRRAIKQVTGGEVEFLINTHLHGDHTGNNASFAEAGTHIIAHEQMRQRLSENPDTPGAALPVLTFSDEIQFHLNDQPARVFHVARAHTDGDAVIYFPEANVIHTGDVLFNGLFPFIDLASGGSVSGYIAAQQQILALADNKTVIVPGHGALATKADLLRANKMLVDIQGRVSRLIAEGKTRQEILALNPLADYSDNWSWDFITTEKMTETLYADLATHRHGPADKAHNH